MALISTCSSYFSRLKTLSLALGQVSSKSNWTRCDTRRFSSRMRSLLQKGRKGGRSKRQNTSRKIYERQTVSLRSFVASFFVYGVALKVGNLLSRRIPRALRARIQRWVYHCVRFSSVPALSSKRSTTFTICKGTTILRCRRFPVHVLVLSLLQLMKRVYQQIHRPALACILWLFWIFTPYCILKMPTG